MQLLFFPTLANVRFGSGLVMLYFPQLILYLLCVLFCIVAPLRRKPNFARHEKGWMRRKRLKAQKRYLRLQEGVNELKAYIQFKQDNKPEW